MSKISIGEVIVKVLRVKENAFLVFALVLLVLGTTGGYPLTQVDMHWRIIAVGMGLLSFAIAAISFLRNPAARISRSRIINEYALKNIEANTNDGGLPVVLTGTYGTRPPEGQVQVIEHDEITHTFRPIGRLHINDENHTWKITIPQLATDHGKKTFIVAYVGLQAEFVFDFYERCLQQTGKSIGMQGLPPGMISLAKKEIILVKDQPGRTSTDAA